MQPLFGKLVTVLLLKRYREKALCLGVPGTADLEALEVEARIKPLELRREELAIRQATKIMSKENDSCINKCWNSFAESEIIERKISSFGKMNIQIADIV